jgi:hypothetical protein
MAFREHYVRRCKWCSKRLVIGLCNADAWRSYEIPPEGRSDWLFHRCPLRGNTRTDVEESLRRLLLDF